MVHSLPPCAPTASFCFPRCTRQRTRSTPRPGRSGRSCPRPPLQGGPGGTALLDGPDTAVETWDDLRASLPEPVLLPRVAQPGTGYKDLLALKQVGVDGAPRAGMDTVAWVS